MSFVSNGPLDVLAFLEIHALGNSRREVDLPLLTFFALYELNFSWVTHMGMYLVIRLDICQPQSRSRAFLSSQGQTPGLL